MIDALHWLIVTGVFVRVFCIARKMDENTPSRPKTQHGLSLILACLSLPVFVPSEAAPVLLGLALWLQLAMEKREPNPC